MGLTARVDHDECVSSGACILEEPDAFAYEDGQALAVVLPGARALSDERLVEVARLCPVRAIQLTDEAGDEIDVS